MRPMHLARQEALRPAASAGILRETRQWSLASAETVSKNILNNMSVRTACRAPAFLVAFLHLCGVAIGGFVVILHLCGGAFDDLVVFLHLCGVAFTHASLCIYLCTHIYL